jgi:hypothetical protein
MATDGATCCRCGAEVRARPDTLLTRCRGCRAELAVRYADGVYTTELLGPGDPRRRLLAEFSPWRPSPGTGVLLAVLCGGIGAASFAAGVALNAPCVGIPLGVVLVIAALLILMRTFAG